MKYSDMMDKFIARYNEILDSDLLTKAQKEEVKEIKKKMEGHIYDPSFLSDWVREIPFEATFNKGHKEWEVRLWVVAVMHSEEMRDFYYLGFNEQGQLFVEMCNDATIDRDVKPSAFAEMSIDDMKKKIKTAMFEGDKILLFKPFDNKKQYYI